MWILNRLHIVDKKLVETQLYKRVLLNRSISTTNLANQSKNDGENAAKPEEVKIVDGFRVIEVFKKSEVRTRRRVQDRAKTYQRPERYRAMPLNQDWTNVWPTQAMFKQSAVPLPLNQGVVKNLVENKGVPPGKYGNAELMKIPNFLHLTPLHIKKHCEAIKKFCTPWPSELKTDEDCQKYFPIEITSTDYVYAGPSIRDERSRFVKLEIVLSSLCLDERSKVKLIKLADHRYNPKTGILTLESGRCPYRKQNYDYVKYLLDVIFNESWKVEAWESEETEADWPRYYWEKSQSKQNIGNLVEKLGKSSDSKDVENYAQKITAIFDKGETKENLDSYKQSVLQLLNISDPLKNEQKQTDATVS